MICKIFFQFTRPCVEFGFRFKAQSWRMPTSLAKPCAATSNMETTLMRYTVSAALALHFDQIGLRDHFAVACDDTLVLLNQLLTNKDSKQIRRTKELNFGFNAPGYPRGPGATRGLAPLRQHTL